MYNTYNDAHVPGNFILVYYESSHRIKPLLISILPVPCLGEHFVSDLHVTIYQQELTCCMFDCLYIRLPSKVFHNPDTSFMADATKNAHMG